MIISFLHHIRALPYPPPTPPYLLLITDRRHSSHVLSGMATVPHYITGPLWVGWGQWWKMPLAMWAVGESRVVWKESSRDSRLLSP